MGKSKAKKAQRYSTPSDKYIIVTDPWGGVPIQEPNFFNNVTAWFEIMLKSKYPGVRPSAIYYQWTNKNIVIELPDHVDAESFLGAHYWKDFLVPPHCFSVAERASYVYEFDYKNHHIPPAQGGWTPGYAAYSKIRPDFDVRDPYPPSRPTQNSLLAFAKKLPPEKLLLPGQEDLPPLPPLPLGLPEIEGLEDRGGGSSSSGSGLNGTNWRDDNGRKSSTMDAVDSERERPDSVKRCEQLTLTRSSQTPTSTSCTSAARDPRRSQTMRGSGTTTNPDSDDPSYCPPGHLAEATEPFLPSLIPSSSSESSVSAKKKMDPYEAEEHAMEFLRRSSTFSTTTATTTAMPPTASVKTETEIKQEPFDHSHPSNDSNVEYMPSTELQAAFASLSQLGCEEEDVKPQIEKELEEGDGYAPSEDLLHALASLSSDMVDLSPTAIDPDNRRDTKRGEVRVKNEPRDDDDSVGHLWSPERIRVKREPESPDRGVFTKKVKLER